MLHCGVDLALDPFEILVHRRQGQERRHLWCGGHVATLSAPTPDVCRPSRRTAAVPHLAMNTPRIRRARRLLPLLALPAAISIGAGHATRRAPPTIPDGYVELIDDTGLLTVTVPDTWTDVDTVPGTKGDGTVQPWISASPDFALFRDVRCSRRGVHGAAVSTEEPAVADRRVRPARRRCTELEVTPYDDGVFVGVAQSGTSCAVTPGTGDVGTRRRQPRRRGVHGARPMQAATAADDEAIRTILDTFNRTAAGSAARLGRSAPAPRRPPSRRPTRRSSQMLRVPAGLGPVEVATMFLDALAAGDGATACALLTAEEMTINFVEEAETCAEELSLQVLGQGEFWASVQIEGDETTSSPGQCGDEDPADEVRLAGAARADRRRLPVDQHRQRRMAHRRPLQQHLEPSEGVRSRQRTRWPTTRPDAGTGCRYTDLPSSPQKGRQCSNASPTGPAEWWFSPRRKHACSTTPTSGPSTSCSA